MKTIKSITPSLMFALVVATLFLSSPAANAAGEAQSVKVSHSSAKACLAAVKADAKLKGKRSEWARCAGLYEKESSQSSGSERGASALFGAAKVRREMYQSFHDKAFVADSIALSNRVMKEYPKSPLADDSLYQIALLRHKPLGEDDKAKLALDYLIENYPEGDMAPKAKEMLASLEKGTEEPEVAPAETPAEEAEPEGKVAEKVDEPEETAPKSAFSADVAGPFDSSHLKKIEVKEGKGATNVILSFTRPVAYAVDYVEEGKRTRSLPKLNLSLSYAKPEKAISKDSDVKSEFINHIRMRRQLLGSGTDLTFTMAPGTSYDVASKGKEIVLSFGNEGVSASAKDISSAKEEKKVVAAEGQKKN